MGVFNTIWRVSSDAAGNLDRSEHRMTHTIEISDDLKERLDRHLEEDQTYEEFIEELLGIYESMRFIVEGV